MERRRQLPEAFGGAELARMITWFLVDTEYKSEGEIKYNHKVPGLDNLLSVILLKRMDRMRRSKQIIRKIFKFSNTCQNKTERNYFFQSYYLHEFYVPFPNKQKLFNSELKSNLFIKYNLTQRNTHTNTHKSVQLMKL